MSGWKKPPPIRCPGCGVEPARGDGLCWACAREHALWERSRGGDHPTTARELIEAAEEHGVTFAVDWMGGLIVSYTQPPPAWLPKRIRQHRHEIAAVLPRTPEPVEGPNSWRRQAIRARKAGIDVIALKADAGHG